MTENFSKEHIPVFFHSSDEYCPMMSVVMVSILEQTKSFIEFFIIETGITDFHKHQIESLHKQYDNFSVTWIPFEYNDIFKKKYFDMINPLNKVRKAWPGIHGYCTPFIPLLAPEFDKIIYLDLDVILLDDIKLFYDEDLKGKAIGGIPDIIQPCFTVEANPKIHNQKFGKYFCGGVLLINAKKFREDNLIDKYFEVAATEYVPTADQDVLNILLENDCVSLDQRYDVIYKVTQEEIDRKGLNVSAEIFKEAAKHTVIRHFADVKPWDIEYFGFASRKELFHHGDWWYFAQKAPFYEALKNMYYSKKIECCCNKSCDTNKSKCKKIYFFGLPLFSIKRKNKKTKIYLFGKLHLFTMKE